ncbi:MAG: phage tail tape measure protein, partial [Clostridiales bacterium]|nr:phage tail tape measure protein [Clostridiales bacterium]
SKSAQTLAEQLGYVGDAASEAEDDVDDLGDDVDDLGDETEDTDNKMDSWAVTLGNLASQAITQLIDKVVELTKEIVEVGIETESAFAKLETIAGAENIDGLTTSITELSTETGVAAADLAGVAYNAISAGASAEEAMDVVTAATKLGVAGFTDSSSALSVLSTAMNSYGDAAGTAEEISDSLIMVQNLGVTTIGELSSVMGKAIATGSAYSVSLGNLESAYVSITKAGINTHEATTYLNSMLNELGDSGSDVSAVLQEKTGKSFTELMEDGETLADVLGILYDSVDGDSTALMNLWSSAEAGKASNAIVNQGLEEFNENLEAITNSAGATESAYETMTDTMETKISIMETGFQNLGLAIYDGLSGPMGDAIDFVNDTFLPGLLGVMDGTESIADFVGDTFDGITEIIENVLQSLMESLPDIISGIVEFLVNAVPNIVEAGIKLLSGIVDAIPDTIINIAENLPDIIQNIVEGLGSGDVDILGAAVELLWNIIKAIPEIVVGLAEAVPDIISGIVEGLLAGVSEVWDAAKELGSSILDSVKSFFGISSPSTVMEEQGEYLVDGLINGMEDMPEESDNILESTLEKLTNWGTTSAKQATSGGSKILSNIKSAISGLPNTMSTTSSDAMSKFIAKISDNLTKVSTTAKSVYTNVTNGLSNLPSTLQTTASNAMTNFNNALNGAISTVSSVAQSIASSVQSPLSSLKSSAYSWGSDLMSNFTSGVNSKISALVSKVQSVASTVKSYLGFSEPEKGPLSDFHTYAPDMMELFARGISENEGVITDAIDDAFDIGDRVSAATATTTQTAASATGSVTININVDGAQYDDVDELTDQIAYKLQKLLTRRTAVYA